ncbi:hypothetical protein BGZ51_008223 [Haplosporangium sp. Z 767]|nr:hypothetical protein BGZ51_008223 [Haplosporangium sp. Z 767]
MTDLRKGTDTNLKFKDYISAVHGFHRDSYSLDSAAENLMVYIGQHGTWTPAHFDHCGTIGHNIMTWADNGSYSIWFIVAAKDKPKVESLLQSLGRNIEFENYFLSVKDFAKADFPVYVVQQKPGDLVLVPSLGYHQVANMGPASIKVAWNRLTTNCLKTAINVLLPRYKEINRPEVYRTKSIIKDTLLAWTTLLHSGSIELPLPKAQFCRSFQELLSLFKSIVEEEWVDLDGLKTESWHGLNSYADILTFEVLEISDDTTPATCNFCHCDIWNRHFHCHQCTSDQGSYDVCTRCYAVGRGCEHRASSMQLMKYFSLESLRLLYRNAIRAWNQSTVLKMSPHHNLILNDWNNR